MTRPTKRQLLHRLAAAENRFRRGHGRVAISRLDALERWIDARRGKAISVTLADAVDEDINFLLGCLPALT